MLQLQDRVEHYLVNVGNDPGERDGIVFQRPTAPLAVDLLDTLGKVVRRGRENTDGRMAVDTNIIEPGVYILRVSRQSNAAGVAQARPPVLELRLAPPI